MRFKDIVAVEFEQDYYKKCREQIEHYEGQLEEKFNYVFKANKTVLDSILKYNHLKNLMVPNLLKYVPNLLM